MLALQYIDFIHSFFFLISRLLEITSQAIVMQYSGKFRNAFASRASFPAQASENHSPTNAQTSNGSSLPSHKHHWKLLRRVSWSSVLASPTLASGSLGREGEPVQPPAPCPPPPDAMSMTSGAERVCRNVPQRRVEQSVVPGLRHRGVRKDCVWPPPRGLQLLNRAAAAAAAAPFCP